MTESNLEMRLVLAVGTTATLVIHDDTDYSEVLLNTVAANIKVVGPVSTIYEDPGYATYDYTTPGIAHHISLESSPIYIPKDDSGLPDAGNYTVHVRVRPGGLGIFNWNQAFTMSGDFPTGILSVSCDYFHSTIDAVDTTVYALPFNNYVFPTISRTITAVIPQGAGCDTPADSHEMFMNVPANIWSGDWVFNLTTDCTYVDRDLNLTLTVETEETFNVASAFLGSRYQTALAALYTDLRTYNEQGNEYQQYQIREALDDINTNWNLFWTAVTTGGNPMLYVIEIERILNIFGILEDLDTSVEIIPAYGWRGGNTLFILDGAPLDGFGADADVVINSTNGDVYIKEEGSWVLSLSMTVNTTFSSSDPTGSAATGAVHFNTSAATVWQYNGSSWNRQMILGDMLKSIYDIDGNGIVDKAMEVHGVQTTGNYKYYGTNVAGTPGFYTVPITRVQATRDEYHRIDTVQYTLLGSTYDVTNVKIPEGVVNGGLAAWTGTGLNISITPCAYFIKGVLYTSAATTVALSAASVSHDRYDVIAVDSTGVVVVEGTPAAIPVKPIIDPSSQVELTFVSIPASATEPDTDCLVIYNENIEWVATASGVSSSDFAYALDPYVGSISGDIVGVDSSDYLAFTYHEVVDVKDYTTLSMAIKLKNSITKHTLWAYWQASGAIIGKPVQLPLTSILTYQSVVVSMDSFALTESVDSLILLWKDNGGDPHYGFGIDYIKLESGLDPIDLDGVHTTLSVTGTGTKRNPVRLVADEVISSLKYYGGNVAGDLGYHSFPALIEELWINGYLIKHDFTGSLVADADLDDVDGFETGSVVLAPDGFFYRCEYAGTGAAVWDKISNDIETEPVYGCMVRLDDDLHLAASYSEVSGATIVAGDVDSTHSVNQTYLQVLEDQKFDIQFTFTGLTGLPVKCHFTGRYNGNPAHNVFIYVWNYDTSAWVRLTAAARDFASSSTDYSLVFNIAQSVDYVSAGEAKIRIYHDSTAVGTHNMYIDYIDILESTVTLTSGGTAYQLDAFTETVSSGVTIDDAAGEITIPSTGDYEVNYSMSFSGTDSLKAQVDLYIDDVYSYTMFKRKLGTSGDTGSASGSVILAFTTGEVVSFWVTGYSTGYISIATEQASIKKLSL